MSEDTKEYEPSGPRYAVLRADRGGPATFCGSPDEARALAAKMVTAHGGSCHVFLLLGTAQAIASWLPAIGNKTDLVRADAPPDRACWVSP